MSHAVVLACMLFLPTIVILHICRPISTTHYYKSEDGIVCIQSVSPKCYCRSFCLAVQFRPSGKDTWNSAEIIYNS